MTANKPFYNFEKIEERGQKKFKKIIAHNTQICIIKEVSNFTNEIIEKKLNKGHNNEIQS